VPSLVLVNASAIDRFGAFSDAVPFGGRPCVVLGVGKSWNKGGLRVAAGIRFFLCFPTFGCIDEQLYPCIHAWSLFRGILYPSGSVSQLDEPPNRSLSVTFCLCVCLSLCVYVLPLFQTPFKLMGVIVLFIRSWNIIKSYICVHSQSGSGPFPQTGITGH
jgi:hypothetical protein